MGLPMKCELAGELTIGTAAQVKAQLLSALEQGEMFDVDTQKVTDVDTAGMQLLVAALTTASNRGISVHYPAEQYGNTVQEALAHLGLVGHDWAQKAAKV